jgi:hypothetical protein
MTTDTSAAPPIGQLFSRVYSQRGEPVQDSPKFRRRLGAYLSQNRDDMQNARSHVEVEVGLRVPISGNSYDWRKLVETILLLELLDTITAIYKGLLDTPYTTNAPRMFVQFVERTLQEENLSYTIDRAGGMHYLIDQEFSRSYSSLMAGMVSPRYAGAREAIDEAFAAMAEVQPNTLLAVRRSFDAVENVFKMMFAEPRLGSSEISKKLKPALAARFSGREGDASKLQAEAMSGWVNASHQYRHAPSTAESSPPSLALATTLVSSGAS